MKNVVWVLAALVIIGGGVFIYQQHEALEIMQQQQRQPQQEQQQQLATLPVEVRSYRFLLSPFVAEQLINHSGQILDCAVTFIHNAVGTENTRHLRLQPYGHSLRFTGFRVGDQIKITSDGYTTIEYRVLGR